MSLAPNLARLRAFVARFTALVDAGADESEILQRGGALLKELVAKDDFLPDAYAQADPAGYRQYLLYCDPQERFSVVSFVWGPGQSTPVHDHGVWGLVGVLRGAEINEPFAWGESVPLVARGTRALLARGEVAAVSPTVGDIHRVTNAIADAPSISIHVYGADIGKVRRATYDAAGRAKPFVSGYSNTSPPDLASPSEAP